MIQEVKELRVKIDGLAQLTKELKPVTKLIPNFDRGKRPANYTLEVRGYGKDEEIPKNPPKCKVTSGFYLEIDDFSNSKEIEKAVDSLLLGKAWLGKVLGELGVDSPYPKDGTRKDINDIEPTADTSNLNKESQIIYASNNSILRDNILTWEDWNNKNHIEKVDWLREKIKSLNKGVIVMALDTQGKSRELSIARTNVYNHLSEARFWLGFELQRIKEEKE